MSGTAPERFAAWMAAREHKDARFGFVYKYHPRSDAHSKELCRLIVEDLIVSSPALRARAEQSKVVYDINCKYTFPVSKKTKTLDFVIAYGIPNEATDPIGGVIHRAAVVRVREGNRWVRKPAVERVLISCESKAAMTEHSKAQPRIFDELSSSHEIVHQGDPEAIAAGITVVNIARTFVSPTRQKAGQKLKVTTHNQPQAAQRMVEHLRGIPIRTDRTGVGFDAYSTLVIDCDNQHMATLHTAAPAPQPGESDHYDTFLAALSQACEERLGK